MKRILLLLAAVGMIFTACQSGGDVEEDNGGTPFVPEITISPKDLTFDCNGGEQAVDITANFEYEVAKRASWLTFEQTDEGLLVVVDANKNTSERSAFISITNSQYDINKTVEVWQEGFVPKIELAQQSVEAEFEPAEYEVAVREATTKNDWIVIESKTGIAGEEVLRFSTKRNEAEKERKGTITLKNTDYNLVAELYITQKAFVPAITIEPESLAFAVEGGTQEVAVTTNFEYEFSTEADWLTIEKSEKGISVTAQNNVEVDERTAEIIISSKKYGVSKVVNVTQNAFVPDEIIIEPEILTFAVEGGTQEVSIIANFEYEYSTNADWLTIKKSEKGLNISATPNTKFEECMAEITISSEKYGISKTISVVQKGVSAKPENVIIYTSSNGKIVTPYKSNVFGANIESNTYRDGQGIIIFDAPVTSIGGSAFSNCTSLTSVTIPNSVTLIGDYTFHNCSSLTSVTIPDSVISIGNYAFGWCKSLTSVTIGNRVTSIGEFAFGKCSSLTSITIPDSVTSIGYAAFYDCTSLFTVAIGNRVTSIGIEAFSGCIALTTITIPDSVTSIGIGAFCYCTSLKAFYGKFASTDNRCLIVDGALNSFAPAGLTEYTISDGITSIGVLAFWGYTSLSSITIPDSVTSIGHKAFYDCTSLSSITIPDSVTSIGKSAFENCTSLTSVYCKPTTPPTGGSNMFSYDSNGYKPLGCKIYVPHNSVNAYKSASYWSEYASYIEDYDF